ncbi:hypothetical protein A3D78_05890 [Candidatus Gottesmanbacteria bacterium RIFCSPHIGHO2_02_FULL_39_14]|uniref:Uncharacterized protein n=1 Tax=Candidatus Gottesmanbacteria bacterium RIFCSPHIGHO2_02_FULL_39_14 TaxID=1798383 RepID=A0A1F6A047_9BACT|nr:MAG: hypothetical protein A3D78_05890 [Candidatus Gottesmanbacteria bacterium RIFCSPHIGHO2_02_FULL_39_14]
MNKKKIYGIRWSGQTKVWSVKLPEKSTVKEVILHVCKKMGFSEDQFDNLTIRGSYRPQDKYDLNQNSPDNDILVIYINK